jgi:hypothetical protein
LKAIWLLPLSLLNNVGAPGAAILGWITTITAKIDKNATVSSFQVDKTTDFCLLFRLLVRVCFFNVN